MENFRSAQPKKTQGLKKFSDWGGDWESYKIYLAEHNALSPELDVGVNNDR